MLLAGFIAARLEKLPPDEALRRAVAAGTASTLVVGSGQFELREAGRLVHDVSVSDLASVAGRALAVGSVQLHERFGLAPHRAQTVRRRW